MKKLSSLFLTLLVLLAACASGQRSLRQQFADAKPSNLVISTPSEVSGLLQKGLALFFTVSAENLNLKIGRDHSFAFSGATDIFYFNGRSYSSYRNLSYQMNAEKRSCSLPDSRSSGKFNVVNGDGEGSSILEYLKTGTLITGVGREIAVWKDIATETYIFARDSGSRYFNSNGVYFEKLEEGVYTPFDRLPETPECGSEVVAAYEGQRCTVADIWNDPSCQPTVGGVERSVPSGALEFCPDGRPIQPCPPGVTCTIPCE